ncbi:MAG: hypothetical protein SGI71_11540 [Verrucomicrobiota bacterium]|nr:hypothetical protein [Verrucomicrobiota bacterium]
MDAKQFRLYDGILGFILFDASGHLAFTQMPSRFSLSQLDDSSQIFAMIHSFELQKDPDCTHFSLEYDNDSWFIVRKISPARYIALFCKNDVANLEVKALYREVVVNMARAEDDMCKNSQAAFFLKRFIHNVLDDSDSDLLPLRTSFAESVQSMTGLSALYIQKVHIALRKVVGFNATIVLKQAISYLASTANPCTPIDSNQFLSTIENGLPPERRAQFAKSCQDFILAY